MCGISGIYNIDGTPVDKEAIEAMCRMLSHRGPDDDGLWLNGSIGFGHKRLSIIDLTEKAHQPMIDTERKLCITYNGEIYNYIELMDELKSKGYHFRSRSDTEVILYSYSEWGVDCVEKFNGMWSFALWDGERKILFCSRDRFGKKPFYYYFDGKTFVFASEIKGILAAKDSCRKPNEPYIQRFLERGIIDDGEETFFDNIKSLPPSHSLTIESSELKTWRYWDFIEEEVRKKYDYKNPEESFRELFKDSVNLRLRSDVPVGTCLSGGLDSSSIVTMASSMLPHPVCTFSSIYDDKDCNESNFIDLVNKTCKTNAYFIKPKEDDLFKLLPKMVWHQDEPNSAPGIFSQWHVMQVAKPHVKVLLDGQGGDELLGGYFYFFPAYLTSLFKNKKEEGKLACARILKQHRSKIEKLTGQSLKPLFAELMRKLFIPRFFDNLFRLPPHNNKKKNSPFMPEFEERIKGKNIERELPRWFEDDLSNALYWALTRESIPSLLHYEDRNSMAFSLEARTPFLDYRLVEFSLGLPYSEKIWEENTKYIMRKALKDILPPEITWRRDKKGYPTPVARWFRDSQKEQVKSILFSESFKSRKILDPAYVEDRFKKHSSGAGDWSWEIWRWLTMEIWFRIFIDGKKLEEAL